MYHSSFHSFFIPFCSPVASAFNLNVSTGNGTFTEDSLAKQWYMSRPFIVPAVSVLFILPFLMLKNIGALSWTRCVGARMISHHVMSIIMCGLLQ